MRAGISPTVWSAPSAGYYPQLYGVNYVLRVDPANASRVYGDANPAFTHSIYGLHAGDTAGIINGLSVSTAATTTSNVGTYAISASGGSAVSVSGQAYRLIDAPGTLTVTPRAITVTADATSRAYGDANPTLTYQVGGSGLVNGDTLSGALATSATSASNIGVYGITQGTLASPNYTVSSFAGANLTVTARAITVTADAKSRAHGDANPVLTYQVGGSGLANGDTLSGALATSATAASNVGVTASRRERWRLHRTMLSPMLVRTSRLRRRPLKRQPTASILREVASADARSATVRADARFQKHREIIARNHLQIRAMPAASSSRQPAN